MARALGKHCRYQTLDWEFSLKDNDKKMKSQTSAKMSRPTGRTAALDSSRSYSREHGFSKSFGVIDHVSSKLVAEESTPDAVSEKELGNEYFKQKRFKEAIDCYSRSIAFSPTAVAYANRAMAYLKIKRFQEAEDDCTNALNLDDRCIKSYSLRATARKELGKLKGTIEDAEFAQRLEPNNQEVKKQYTEVKSLYEKMKSNKACFEKERKLAKMNTCGQNKKQMITAPFLHDEIFFNILTWLPAQYLYDYMKYVCNSFATIVRDLQFAEAHLDQSKLGLCVQDATARVSGLFLEIKDDGAIISQAWTSFPCLGLLKCSSGGLAVMEHESSSCLQYVINIATRKVVEIPQVILKPGLSGCRRGIGIARVSRTRECKLACAVHSFSTGKHVIYFYVLTLGIDKSWRLIDDKIDNKNGLLTPMAPISIGKFLFWVETVVMCNWVVAMDLDRESIRVLYSPIRPAGPFLLERTPLQSGYLNKGGYLACVSHENLVYCMHILVDVYSGKWILHHRFKIPLSPEFGEYPWRMKYICCLGNNEELIFSVRKNAGDKKVYFAFSLKTNELRHIDNYIKSNDAICVHTNSLIYWKTS